VSTIYQQRAVLDGTPITASLKLPYSKLNQSSNSSQPVIRFNTDYSADPNTTYSVLLCGPPYGTALSVTLCPSVCLLPKCVKLVHVCA